MFNLTFVIVSFFTVSLRYFKQLFLSILIYISLILNVKFNKFTKLYNHHHNPVLDYHPKKFLHSFAVNPYTDPQLKASTNLLCVSLVLSFLEISYKQNHPICSCMCLASFTQYNILRFIHVVPCISHSFLKNCLTLPYFKHFITFWHQCPQPWTQPFLQVTLDF